MGLVWRPALNRPKYTKLLFQLLLFQWFWLAGDRVMIKFPFLKEIYSFRCFQMRGYREPPHSENVSTTTSSKFIATYVSGLFFLALMIQQSLHETMKLR